MQTLANRRNHEGVSAGGFALRGKKGICIGGGGKLSADFKGPVLPHKKTYPRDEACVRGLLHCLKRYTGEGGKKSTKGGKEKTRLNFHVR